MPKVLITTSSFNTDTPEIKALEAEGYEIMLNPHKRRLSEDEIRGLLMPDIEGLIAGLEPLNRAVLEGTDTLKVISRCGTGMDNVDLNAAQERGIKVFNTPDAPTDAVAELTIGLILSVLRGIPLQDRALRNEGWERPMGGLLGARTLGLIGLGRIGSRVSEYAAGFGTKVIAYDPASKTSDVAEITDLDTVLGSADVISLHVPYNADNHHFINKHRLNAMKAGAILVNTARGGLVDEEAVAESIKSGHLSGAAFDVYEQEPYKGVLSALDNVVLSAHVGSYAKEARAKQETQAAQNLLAGLKGIEEGMKAYG